MCEAVRSGLGFVRAAILLGDRSVVTSDVGWLDTFTRNRGLDVAGADLVGALGTVGSRLLDDPRPLDAVLTG